MCNKGIGVISHYAVGLGPSNKPIRPVRLQTRTSCNIRVSRDCRFTSADFCAGLIRQTFSLNEWTFWGLYYKGVRIFIQCLCRQSATVIEIYACKFWEMSE